MFSNMVAKIFNSQLSEPDLQLREYFEYVKSAYPSNHTYNVSNKKFYPGRQLAARYKVISSLFPKSSTSLLDIGCSKGFFVFSASEQPGFTRGLGIDVNPYNIEVCQSLKRYVNNPRVGFERLKLHEVAARIDEFGGAYQTVLILNTYQYLYFGSDSYPHGYFDHDVIFKNLSKICNQRVIFNNRVNVEDCQNTACIDRVINQKASYSEEKMLEVASNYFKISQYADFGRYPLWTFDVR